ncbi:MAG: hypothetical protein QM754_12330 [Tepidisphaeraceae bacterium]
MPGLFKTVAQYLLAGLTLLGVVAAGIAYYDLSPDERSAMWHGIGRVLVWLGIVLVLPWATYFVTTAVARRESNAAGVLLILGYTIVDAVILYLLVGAPAGAFLICAAVLGLLVALTYNLLTCDFVAERGT